MKFLIWTLSIPLIICCASCAGDAPKTSINSKEIQQLDKAILLAAQIKEKLLLRADSLNRIDEFEVLKIQNIVNMLDENVNSLKDQQARINASTKQDSINELLPIAITQAQYIESLIASGQAIVDNRSLSFGNWQGDNPKAENDSLTPNQKQKKPQ